MKVTLICNTALPVFEEYFQLPKAKPESWLIGHVDALKKRGCAVTVCFPIHENKQPISEIVEGIKVVSYARDKNITRYNDAAEADFIRIFREVQPDIIHVFGTEFPHVLSAVNAAEKCGMLERLVISIQGMVSLIGKYHFYAGLPVWMHHAKSFRDFVRRDSLAYQRNLFIQRGRFETEAIQKARHVIGRTDWDRACVEQINPDVNYHFCNETLRAAFYQNSWQKDACRKNSIFVSQANYPLKGFHIMLEALAIIVKKYPDAHLYTTGADPRARGDIQRKIRQGMYAKYLEKRIKDLGLDKNVTFLGYLDENQMCEQFLKSHIFVSCSSVENSPNSLGEAMLLGVPCISSDVGGVKNMMLHGEEGYIYPFDEPYMIAYYADKILSSDDLAKQLSVNAKEHASQTYNQEKNAKTMQDIYEIISRENVEAADIYKEEGMGKAYPEQYNTMPE